MIQIMMVRNFLVAVAIMLSGVSLSGCDYWPPALQAQVEQLRAELQMVTAEKVQLENQVASFGKVRDDLQAQVDDLTKANRDKAAMIGNLQGSLAAAQVKSTKSMKVTAPKYSPKRMSVKRFYNLGKKKAAKATAPDYRGAAIEQGAAR